MKIADTVFKVGDRVRYVPTHAYNDQGHPDCETGVVTSLGPRSVFVRFDKQVARLGFDGATSQGCYPEDLRLI